MAEYTIELRHIVEGGRNIFNFPYVFYDESKKYKFEEKFIKHFYFREIGAETIDRFLWFLEDKFNTVLPYYNKLFETANIDYAILDNYKLTETINIKRDNVGKSSGVSSTVGQTFDNQETQGTEQRDSNTTGKVETVGSVTDTGGETTSSETNGTTSSETDTTECVDGESTRATNSTQTSDQEINKKFLDTPQGLTNLTDSKYVTTLNQDIIDSSQTTTSTENGTEKRTTTGTNDSTTTTSSTTTGEVNKNNQSDSTTTQDSTGTESGNVKTSATFTGEQKTTADNNTRATTEGSMTETMTTTRVGNIGVDTDSDVIQKHIKLQEILTKIEMMFFDECEDLFMGVY